MVRKEASQILNELANKKKGWAELCGQKCTAETVEALRLGALALREDDNEDKNTG